VTTEVEFRLRARIAELEAKNAAQRETIKDRDREATELRRRERDLRTLATQLRQRTAKAQARAARLEGQLKELRAEIRVAKRDLGRERSQRLRLLRA
jgi:chromosome segregation ATPase